MFYLDNLTNGITSELITATDGLSLLGIRVVWKIKSMYLKCPYSSLSVELRSRASGLQTNITVNDSSAEFYNTTCNTLYSPRLIAKRQIIIEVIGNQLFYGGM